MRNMGFATAMVLVLATSAQAQVYDSTGQPNTAIGYGDAIYSSTWDRISGKPETAMRWPTWEEVTGKPASASRWPSWNEVTGKPSTFPPTAHNHDDRYVRKGASGAISGNLSVSGTVTGNRLVTGDVGGDRWCRANSAGRVQCTHSAPTGGASIDGWPVSLRCGTAIWTLMRVSDTEIAYRGCGGGKSTRCDIMRYNKKTGDYKGRESYGGAGNTGCNVNFHSIPASRKG